MRNSRNIFKRGLCIGIAFVSLALSGCSKDETSDSSDGQSSSTIADTGIPEKPQYVNLNFDNAVVNEYAPKSGDWTVMRFDRISISADTFTVLREAADALGKKELNAENVLCDVCFNNNDWGDVGYSEMTDSYYGNTDYMRYIDDDFYIDISVANRIEAYNRKALREIAGKAYDTTWGWKPGFTGEKGIKSYDLSTGIDIADTYTLNGEEVSVSAAAKYAGDMLNGGGLAHMASPFYTYTPLSADVYQFSDDVYGYHFKFQLNYDGVAFDGTDSANTDGKGIYANSIRLLMLTGSSIDWLWSNPISSGEPVSAEKCEIAIDFDEACRILSETFSRESVFNIRTAELLYCVCTVNENGSLAEPMWQFTFGSGVQEYRGGLCVNVSALSGEVYMRQLI